MTSVKRARFALIASIIITLFLYLFLDLVPFGDLIARPLILISTLVHELGHGFAGMLVGESFESFKMYYDGSGIAKITKPSNSKAQAFISMGGLVGPAFIGGLLLLVGKYDKICKRFLIFLGVVLLLTDIFIVENMDGWVFVTIFGGMTLLVGLKASKEFCQWYSYFIGVQLGLSVFSRSDYLFTEYAIVDGSTKMPSDVGQISHALFFPYWVWGIVCAVISVFFLAVGLHSVFTKPIEK